MCQVMGVSGLRRQTWRLNQLYSLVVLQLKTEHTRVTQSSSIPESSSHSSAAPSLLSHLHSLSHWTWHERNGLSVTHPEVLKGKG